jgi:hypothetical protein
LALLEAGIDPRTRGEELALVDFVRLADAIFRDATGPTSLRNE